MDKNLVAGSTALLVLKLLEEEDMYGYQMVEELRRRSDKTFDLKSGTLYPLLHSLEQKGAVTAREELVANGSRLRRYYHLTETGRKLLAEKESQWRTYASVVFRMLEGGSHA
jgi:PadR family transcriptional regulator PadR